MKKIFLLLLVTLTMFSQVGDEWELVSSSRNSTTYMNAKDLSSFKGDDVYVWVMEKHNPPIVIETIDDRIYKTKTYYLFSKQYQRYSMIQIIYYDEDDNVLKSFDYNRDTNIPTYRYNFPVMRGSTQEVIFERILKATGTATVKEKKGNE